MEKWRRLTEERIRDAIEAGAFDNLPGAGQPFPPEEKRSHASDWNLAFRVLRNADMAPRWIELDKEVRKERARLRAELKRAQRRWPQGSPGRPRAAARFRQEAVRLNARIKLRNQLAPGALPPRFPLDIEGEIHAVGRNGDG